MSFNDKIINTRVFLPYMAAPRDRKFDFTQSYGRSYGGIVPVFVEFTAPKRARSADTTATPTPKMQNLYR